MVSEVIGSKRPIMNTIKWRCIVIVVDGIYGVSTLGCFKVKSKNFVFPRLLYSETSFLAGY